MVTGGCGIVVDIVDSGGAEDGCGVMVFIIKERDSGVCGVRHCSVPYDLQICASKFNMVVLLQLHL